MKKKIALILLLAVALLVAMAGTTAAAPPAPDNSQAVSEQILVKFRVDTAEGDKDEIHRKHGGQVLGVIPGIDVQVVRVKVKAVQDKVKEYKGEGRIEFAEPDYIATAVLTPSDPYFPYQWGLTRIQAPEAWNITTGSSSVRIAVLDTGIDQNHEDLVGKIVANKNFSSSRTVDDRYGHGTHVAGIAAASTNNGKGVAGAGFNSTLMNVKVLSDNGSGNYSWIANGITWAANNGAKVINLSLGGGSPSDTLRSAVDYAWSRGAVVVAAAGNSNTSSPLYPAYYSNAIAVAATDSSDVRASFSNYGAWVDIAAPGVDIYSTVPNHSNRLGVRNYAYLSGTSMATPAVAGVTALIFAANSGWSNTEVRSKLQVSVDPASGFTTTIGRVNALKSVSP